MYRLLRTSSRNDGTSEGTWSAGDEFRVESAEELYEYLDTGRGAWPAGGGIPPRRSAPVLERAAFGGGETPEHAGEAPHLRSRGRAGDGGA